MQHQILADAEIIDLVRQRFPGEEARILLAIGAQSALLRAQLASDGGDLIGVTPPPGYTSDTLNALLAEIVGRVGDAAHEAAADPHPQYLTSAEGAAAYAPISHTHAAADITSGQFDPARIPQAGVTQHQGALSIGWSQLTGLPAFATRWPTWSEVTDKPTTFPPSAHTHTTIESQRRAMFVLTTSDPAFPIPSWAQDGKGVLYVTGCGGGGSGGVNTTTGQRGGGGGSAAVAVRVPLNIPSGATTLSATVGAGAPGVSAAGTSAGMFGGESSVSIGGVVRLKLGGGGAGAITSGGSGGFVNLPATNGPAYTSTAAGLGAGVAGGSGNTTNGGFGAGAPSAFGLGGDGFTSGPSANTNGGNASGNGAGGAGALWLSGAAATSGAGAPGFLILEFVEGF